MPLPVLDTTYLTGRERPFTVAEEANMTCVVVPGFSLPAGCAAARSDLLIRLSSGYPDVAPDMWWFDPPVQAADGRVIECTQTMERHLGRLWQRWSRHFTAGQWRPGIDSLETFLALIQREVARSTERTGT